MNLVKDDIIDLRLDYLPGLASYILEYKREEFVKTLLANSYEADIPILKYFRSMPAEEMFKISMESNTMLLTALKNKTPLEYIQFSAQNWIKNQLQIISRDQVVVEDITLINYARKKTFREMLQYYTQETAKMVRIMDEVDRFSLTLDSVLFKTYFGIQQEKLKDANNELQKRETELLEAQSIASIGSFEWDLSGNHNSSYTPEVFKIFELEKTSSLDAFLQDVHPDDRLKLQAAIEKAMHDGIYECEYRYNRNNKAKILNSKGKVFFENGRPLKMVGTVTDVTEKAQLIARLKESEDLSKQAQALTHTGNWKWTIEKDQIEWSDEMYRIYGLEPQSEEITFDRFVAFIHEDDRKRRLGEITDAIRTGKASDYIMKIVLRDGTQKILKGKGEVILDKNNHTVGMLGTCQDITYEYYLTAELKRKNEELVRKNRDLESFNFIASHDLQEPLRKIQLYSNRMVKEATDLPPRLYKYFERISLASNSMQKMIEDFLLFYQSLGAQETASELDLNKIIEDIRTDLLEIITKKNAEISVVKLPVIIGIKPQISQMFKHLISNALKFSKQAEHLKISIDSSIENTEDDKAYYKISIRDNGIGFDQKYAKKIFELFQRLHSKDEYSGSGIGLPLCKKIAEDHKGWISVTSESGKGSVFSVWLPKT